MGVLIQWGEGMNEEAVSIFAFEINTNQSTTCLATWNLHVQTYSNPHTRPFASHIFFSWRVDPKIVWLKVKTSDMCISAEPTANHGRGSHYQSKAAKKWGEIFRLWYLKMGDFHGFHQYLWLFKKVTWGPPSTHWGALFSDRSKFAKDASRFEAMQTSRCFCELCFRAWGSL